MVAAEIIERYGSRLHMVFEPDDGPADGLNKGFALATGDIFGFLNADDTLLPGALHTVAAAFARAPEKDVLSGHTIIIDQMGGETNRFFSRRFSPSRYVYGASVIAQQSTFFRSAAFRAAGGFNQKNRLTWDGELWVDLALSGATFGRIPAFLSTFRVYPESISGSRGRAREFRQDRMRMFLKVKGRPPSTLDAVIRLLYKAGEYTLHPNVTRMRLLHGPHSANMNTSLGYRSYGWDTPEPPASCAYLGPAILALARSLQPRRVLDIGCGNGALMASLLKRGYDVVGIEPDTRGIALARTRCPQGRLYPFSVGDEAASILSKEEAPFDLIVSSEVIEHLPYPRDLLQFGRKILTPNGYLILTTPYHGYFKNLALALLNRFDAHHHPLRDGGHLKFFSTTTIRQLLWEEGFRTLRIGGAGRLPLFWKSMVVLAQPHHI